MNGGSNLPDGQILVGMFAYPLMSGHWQVQTGVAGLGEEGSLTVAMVIPLTLVVGWDQRWAGWANVAWLAMRVHVEKVGKGLGGGGELIEGRMSTPTPPALRGPKRKVPPPPTVTPQPTAATARRIRGEDSNNQY